MDRHIGREAELSQVARDPDREGSGDAPLLLQGKLPDAIASRGELLAERSCRQGENRFHAMGVLDIMREASTLLRANSSLLMSIMAALICPVSAALLSQLLVNRHLLALLSLRLHDVAQAAGLLHTPLNKALLLKLSHTLLSYAFSFPVLATLWLLAKASISFAVACTYAGKKASIHRFMPVAPKLWKRLLATYLWICLVLLGFSSVSVLFLLLVVSFLDALEFSADLVLLSEIVLGLMYSVVFAHMMVICNLASVVSVLEEYSGIAAIIRSLFLMKGRTQVALLLFLGTAMSTTMVESLFQYRVIGMPGSRYPTNTASRLWEGPLLVFMYSFLYLFDVITSCVFYFTCKSARLESSDKFSMLEHVSIGLDLMEQ